MSVVPPPPSAGELEATLLTAARAIARSPYPAAAMRRLRQWAERENRFSRSPAALSDDDLVECRTSGISPQQYANGRRFARG